MAKWLRSVHGVTIVTVGNGRNHDPQEAGARGDEKRVLDAEAGSWTATEQCAMQSRCTTFDDDDDDVVVKRNFVRSVKLGPPPGLALRPWDPRQRSLVHRRTSSEQLWLNRTLSAAHYSKRGLARCCSSCIDFARERVSLLHPCFFCRNTNRLIGYYLGSRGTIQLPPQPSRSGPPLMAGPIGVQDPSQDTAANMLATCNDMSPTPAYGGKRCGLHMQPRGPGDLVCTLHGMAVTARLSVIGTTQPCEIWFTIAALQIAG
jgi:hypothetical protein